MMSNMFEFNRKKVFSVSEAGDLLPLIYKITEASSKEVKSLIERLECAKSQKKDGLLKQIDSEINLAIDRWQRKVEKLGALPKGLWIVDFDSGNGYFCWKFPERQLRFWHGYQDSQKTLIKFGGLNE
jgi:hypothetical protein